MPGYDTNHTAHTRHNLPTFSIDTDQLFYTSDISDQVQITQITHTTQITRITQITQITQITPATSDGHHRVPVSVAPERNRVGVKGRLHHFLPVILVYEHQAHQWARILVRKVQDGLDKC